MRTLHIALLLSITAACGVDPAKIPNTKIYADDGASVSHERYINFAVVGATRVPISGTGEPEAPVQTVADVRAEKPVRDLSFAVLNGGMVARSTTKEWTSFAERWSPILRGEVISENQSRMTVLPVPGPGEVVPDKNLKGFGAAFDGVGADIGFGRVASWSRVDAQVGKARWRLLFLDANASALGTRWDEQKFWLPGQVSGDDYDHLVVFMNEPRFTTAKGFKMSSESASAELLEIVDAHSDLLNLTAVFSGGPASNEVYLPTGAYGEAYIVAGNGGIPGASFARGATAEEAGLDENLQLESAFTRVLVSEFSQAASGLELSDKVKETFNGSEGNPPEMPGADFPVQGWWSVTLGEGGMSTVFRMRRYDGTFRDSYKMVWTRKNGWQTEAL